MRNSQIWEGDKRWNPDFIELSGIIIGFLVVLFEDLDTDPEPTHLIYDFMILQKDRRNGIGQCAQKKRGIYPYIRTRILLGK